MKRWKVKRKHEKIARQSRLRNKIIRDKSLQGILQEIMKYTDIRNYKTGQWEETDEDTRDLVFVEEKLKENDINTKFVERLRRI